ESSDDNKSDIMRRKGAWLSVRSVLANPRTEDDGQRHRGESAHGVDDSRAGKIHVAVGEVHGRTQLREPAAAPNPTAEDRIHEGANEEFTEDKPPDRDPLTDGPDDNVPSRLHEHDFEERQRITSHIVGRAA